MKSAPYSWFALAFLIPSLSPATSSQAQGEADEPGFRSLFNGKDLSGWRYKGSTENLEGRTETADGRVAVENGVIVMREKDRFGKGGIRELQTRETFPEGFHLRVDFRAGPRADSGVYLRGTQLQVRDFIRRNEKKHLKKFVDDGWNTLDIVVRNDVMTVNVDGKEVTTKDRLTLSVEDGMVVGTLNGKTLEPRRVEIRKGPVADCRCNGEPLEVMTTIPATGAIGLQAESGKFEFRRVRIKNLK